MTHRGPFQPLLFCDSVILRGGQAEFPSSAMKGGFCLAQRRSSPGRRSVHGNGAGNGFQMLLSSREVGRAKGEPQRQMLPGAGVCLVLWENPSWGKGLPLQNSPPSPQSLGRRAGAAQERGGWVWAKEEAFKGLLPSPAPSRAVWEGNLPKDAAADRKGLALMAH